MRSHHKQFLLITVFLLMLSCNTKQKDENRDKSNDLKKLNLYGAVKTLKEKNYTETGKNTNIIKFNKNGQIINQASFNNDSTLIRRFIFKYEEGKISSQKCFITGDTLSFKTKFNYSPQHKLISTKIIEKNGTSATRSSFEYDNHGNQITETYFNKDGSIEKSINKTFNEQNQVILSKNIDNIQNNRWIKKFKYNNEGLKSQKSIFSFNQDTLIQKIKYYYTNNNQVSKKIINQPIKNKNETRHYQYDKYGNVTKIKTYYGQKEQKTKSISYSYDKKGNWIRALTKINGKTKKISNRNFKYYN